MGKLSRLILDLFMAVQFFRYVRAGRMSSLVVSVSLDVDGTLSRSFHAHGVNINFARGAQNKVDETWEEWFRSCLDAGSVTAQKAQEVGRCPVCGEVHGEREAHAAASAQD